MYTVGGIIAGFALILSCHGFLNMLLSSRKKDHTSLDPRHPKDFFFGLFAYLGIIFGCSIGIVSGTIMLTHADKTKEFFNENGKKEMAMPVYYEASKLTTLRHPGSGDTTIVRGGTLLARIHTPPEVIIQDDSLAVIKIGNSNIQTGYTSTNSLIAANWIKTPKAIYKSLSTSFSWNLVRSGLMGGLFGSLLSIVMSLVPIRFAQRYVLFFSAILSSYTSTMSTIGFYDTFSVIGVAIISPSTIILPSLIAAFFVSILKVSGLANVYPSDHV